MMFIELCGKKIWEILGLEMGGVQSTEYGVRSFVDEDGGCTIGQGSSGTWGG